MVDDEIFNLENDDMVENNPSLKRGTYLKYFSNEKLWWEKSFRISIVQLIIGENCKENKFIPNTKYATLFDNSRIRLDMQASHREDSLANPSLRMEYHSWNSHLRIK